MPKRKTLSMYVMTTFLILLLSACSSVAAPVPAQAVPETVMEEVGGQEPVVVAPAQPEESARAPVEPKPAPTAQIAVITPDNLTLLVPYLLGLPEYPERILWPAPGTPGVPENADVLLQSGANLYPLALDLTADLSMTLLDSISLPLNGNTIVAFAPDASSLLVQEPGRLAVYRIDGSLVREIDVLEQTGWAGYSPDSSALVITSQEEFVAFVYGADGSITKLDGFETAAPVYGAVLGPQGESLAWLSRGTLQFHDVTAVKDGLGARQDFAGFIGPVAFSTDGSRLALDVEGELHLYNVSDGSQVAQLPLDAPVSTLAFSPAGDILAANFGDGFQTWNAHTLEPLVSLPTGGGDTVWVGFSPDGTLLLTLHNDNELRLWRVE
jgi:WD40 repeat protein